MSVLLPIGLIAGTVILFLGLTLVRWWDIVESIDFSDDDGEL